MEDLERSIKDMARSANIEPEKLKRAFLKQVSIYERNKADGLGILNKDVPSDPKARQRHFLQQALSSEIFHDTEFRLAPEMAEAFLMDNQEAMSQLMNDVSSFSDIRRSGNLSIIIQQCIHSRSGQVCLPLIDVHIGHDFSISHPTISEYDRGVFIKLYKQRTAIMAAFYEDAHRQADLEIKRGDHPPGHELTPILLAHRVFDQTHKRQWYFDNNQYPFLSLSNHERRVYDIKRSEHKNPPKADDFTPT